MARTVVITGASTGIGRACALRLDSAGWQVFAGVRKTADADSLRAEASEQLVPLMIDVGDGASIAAAAQEVSGVTGGTLDALVNNAGISVQGPLEHLPLDEIRKQFEINVTGQVAVTQAFLPMLRSSKGRIVFMGSVAGRAASLPFIGPYSASKLALEGIADSLRGELRPAGIAVSIVEPGSIATEIWQKGDDTFDELAAMVPESNRTYYSKALGNARKLGQTIGGRGISPDVVAKKVEHALASARPRTRYLVGKDALMRVYVEKPMPDKIRDRIATKMLFGK